MAIGGGEEDNALEGLEPGGGTQGTLIKTETSYSIVNNVITILSKYVSDLLGGVSRAFISDKVQTVEGISFKEGQGGITKKSNYSKQLDFVRDNRGHLIVTAPDATQYSINEEGNLIYTYTE